VFNITKKKQIQTWHFTFEILRTFLNVQYVNTIFKYRSSVRCWNWILIWSLILFSKHKNDVHIYWYWCCLNISAVLTDTDTKIKCLKTKIYRLQLVLKDTISRDNQPNLKDLHWSNPNTNLWSLIRNPEYQISISWSGEGGEMFIGDGAMVTETYSWPHRSHPRSACGDRIAQIPNNTCHWDTGAVDMAVIARNSPPHHCHQSNPCDHCIEQSDYSMTHRRRTDPYCSRWVLVE